MTAIRPDRIDKTPAALRVTPNWPATAAARAAFSWAEEAKGLTGLPGGGLNQAFEAVDRHAAGPLRGHTALRLGVNIPEADYQQLTTLDVLLAYLRRHLAGG